MDALISEPALSGTAELRAGIRAAEKAELLLFSRGNVFSPHLYRWQDPALLDMYDHNAFVVSGTPSPEELEAAVRAQLDAGQTFVKLECRAPLPAELLTRYSCRTDSTLTMALIDGCADSWKRNPRVEVRDLRQHALEEDLTAVELQNYGESPGSFTRRKLRRYYDIAKSDTPLHLLGAYLDGVIVGSCSALCTGAYLGLDDLVVNENARKQYVATTLLAEAIARFGGLAYLHADPDDTPRHMYRRMGFCEVDTLYAYHLQLSGA